MCRLMLVCLPVAVRHSRLFMDDASGDLDAVSAWLQGFECAGSMVCSAVARRHSRLFMDDVSGNLDVVSVWLQGF